jgi:hypothetical protein
MNMLFKNFLFYGLSNFANPWVADAGPTQIMYVFGGTSLALSLLAIPVCHSGGGSLDYLLNQDLRCISTANDCGVGGQGTTFSLY